MVLMRFMLHAYRKRFINVWLLYKSSVTFEDKTQISNFKIQIKAHTILRVNFKNN